MCAVLTRELKSNMGRDELEGDVPLLLQMIMARSPEIFREKNMPIQYGTPEGELIQYVLNILIKICHFNTRIKMGS